MELPSALGVTSVLIIYYSRFGVVREQAKLIFEGVKRVPMTHVELLEVQDQPIAELHANEHEQDMASRRAVIVNKLDEADALIVGAPTYFGSMASPIKRLFEDTVTANPPPTDRTRPWLHHRFRDKVGAAFTASGTPHGGNEMALHSILTMMMHLGMIVVTPGQGQPILANPAAPYGPTAIAGPEGDQALGDQAEAEARALGERVARLTTWLRWGRTMWNDLENDRRLAEWEQAPNPKGTSTK
jgi:NAD(P)H dehydrogenase (quinone)